MGIVLFGSVLLKVWELIRGAVVVGVSSILSFLGPPGINIAPSGKLRGLHVKDECLIGIGGTMTVLK